MSGSVQKKRNRNLLLKLRPLLRWIIKLRSSPEAIAGGLALGTFLAFTPTVGVQILLAVVLATFFNVNRAATIIPVWISNPVTIAPIYTVNYWLGCHLIPGPPISEVSGLFIGFSKALARLELWDIEAQFFALLNMGREIILPLTLGSLIIGALAGMIVYSVFMRLIVAFLRRRARRHHLNAIRRKKNALLRGLKKE